MNQIEESKTIRWQRVLLESIVIVGSILLAFGIDAAWDRLQEREDEAEFLAALTRDMRANQAEAARVTDLEKRSSAALDAFLAATPGDLATLTADSANVLFRRLAVGPVFTPFQGALRSRDLSLLSNHQLRDALGTWSGLAADVVENTPLLLQNVRAVRLTMDNRALRYLLGSEITGESARILARLRADDLYVRNRLTMEMTRQITVTKVQRLDESTSRVLALLRDS